MENLRDWPISRQIAWGIPIPAWHRGTESRTGTERPEGEGWTKDEDTFDTWFSSGQWPYATLQALGNKDFADYFPTQLMETGWDIIFFWVARMIMLSYYRTGKPPFETVYLHGLVRDAKGQKISKSKGNVIMLSDMTAKYGTDALRMALVFSTAAGNDIPLGEDKIRGMKHFANKLWNIARFVLEKTDAEADFKDHDAPDPQDWSVIQDLGLLRGNPVKIADPSRDDARVVDKVTNDLAEFRLHEAAQTLYNSVWHEFADIYIEHCKKTFLEGNADAVRLKSAILRKSLSAYLKLLHPFVPFVTEELWGRIHGTREPERLLLVQPWPVVE
jgi:valyl-tRNA synthetase